MNISRYQSKIENAQRAIERYENQKQDIDFEISQLKDQVKYYKKQIAEIESTQTEEE